MKFYAQVISEALFSDPPMVRGIIDGDTIRRLRGYHGDGRKRVFTFDVVGNVPVSALVKRKERVALAWRDGHEALLIRGMSRKKSLFCPCCGLEMLTPEFWPHYNRFHARRMWWLNREDWSKMGISGEYVPPPEQM